MGERHVPLVMFSWSRRRRKSYWKSRKQKRKKSRDRKKRYVIVERHEGGNKENLCLLQYSHTVRLQLALYCFLTWEKAMLHCCANTPATEHWLLLQVRRQLMEDSVPPEPIADCGEKLCTMRIRFPDGTTEQRRFLARHRLKVSCSPPKCLNRILPLLLLLLGLDELFWCQRILSFRLQNSHWVSKKRCTLLLHYERPHSSIPLSFTHNTSLSNTLLPPTPPYSWLHWMKDKH